jgi:hypothetical protein
VKGAGSGPETWGEINAAGRFEWRLKLKLDPGARPGLQEGSLGPRFDARLSGGSGGPADWINPFTGEIGGRDIGSHLPLDVEW